MRDILVTAILIGLPALFYASSRGCAGVVVGGIHEPAPAVLGICRDPAVALLARY